MNRNISPITTIPTTGERPIIDPEIVETVYAGNPANRHDETWDNNGSADAHIVRHITLRAAQLYRENGEPARDAYLEAAGTLLEALRQQAELERQLAA